MAENVNDLNQTLEALVKNYQELEKERNTALEILQRAEKNMQMLTGMIQALEMVRKGEIVLTHKNSESSVGEK